MASAQAFELNSDPIGDIAATLDVVSEEALLGGGGDRLPIKQAEISLGRLQLYRLEPTPETTTRLLPGPDRSAWRFYLVVFPFTLHPIPERSVYEKVTFTVAVSDPTITAFALIPERVVDEQERKRTIKLGFKLPFKVGETEAGVEDQIVLKDLRPIITAFGLGENKFSWLYSRDDGVNLGSRRTAAIVQMPFGVRSTTVVITYDCALRRRWYDLGISMDVTARTEPWTTTLAFD